MSGSGRVRTAGLKIKQASSADKKKSQSGREENTGREGIKQSEKRALCSLSKIRRNVKKLMALMILSLYLVSGS